MRSLRVVLLAAAAVAAGAAAAATLRPRTLPRSAARARGGVVDAPCKAGLCGGMARYPALPGTRFYSTFSVPGLPLNASAAEDVTFFIYTNIFFDGYRDGTMNQFVNQLMLGNPLSGSTGAPDYLPLWSQAATWVFGAQYFMETAVPAAGTAHAAAGPLYNCTEGDVLWTEYALGADWAWTLSMGVVGDASRTSTLVVAQPFMGLLANETTSWSEPAYDHVYYNGCWELYGVTGGTNYPSSSSIYEMRTTRPAGTDYPWQTTWSDVEWANCPGHPNGTFTEIHNATQQSVGWLIFFPPGA